VDDGVVVSVDGGNPGGLWPDRAGDGQWFSSEPTQELSPPRALLRAGADVGGKRIHLGADIGAMGSSVALLMPGTTKLFTIVFGLVSLLAVLFIPYTTYAKYLKWLTVSLFAYVAVAFLVHVPWRSVLGATLIPRMAINQQSWVALIAVLGTTISPYLFFWQASQEVEEVKNNRGEKALKRAPAQANAQLRRIHTDTLVGMAFSNAVAFFIILTAASTLHTHGITNVSTCAQAASALTPIAGHFAGALFVCGIVGTGLLAVPILAASAAYAISEGCKWKTSLQNSPRKAPGFYAVITFATANWSDYEFLSYRPHQVSRLGRSSERNRRSSAHGGHHVDSLESQGDGQVLNPSISSLHRLAGYCRHGFRQRRCCSDLEMRGQQRPSRQQHSVVLTLWP